MTGSTQQVAHSRAQHGEDALTLPERDPWWRDPSKFEDPVIRILIIAAVVAGMVNALEKNPLFESPGIVAAILLATGV